MMCNRGVRSSPLATALVAAALLAACAGSRATPGAASGPPRKLTVVGINDTHGALLALPPPKWLARVAGTDFGGADWFAGYVDAMRADAQEHEGAVVILDGGDMFQGTLISNQFQGRSVTDVYNAIGVDAACIGNHEFDFGKPALLERIAGSKFPVLSANIFKKDTHQRPDWARPTAMLNLRGLKVGIIGLTTVETPIVTNATNIGDVEFLPGGPIAAQLADELRAQGAQVVLITAHMGRKGDGEILRVAEAVKGKVDGIVSGHHHESIGPPGLVHAGIPIVQSGAKLQAFSTIGFDLDAAGKVTGFSVNQGNQPRNEGPQALLHTMNGRPATYLGRVVQPDAKVSAIVADYDGQVRKLRDSNVGATELAITKGGRDDLLANLAADALRSGAGGSVKTNFAVQNSGGLRITEIAAGSISFGQIFDLYPFDNQQVVLTLPAHQVRDLLEAVLHAGKGSLKPSGLRYTIDWNRYGAAANVKEAPPGAIVTEVIDESTGKPLCATKSCTAQECVSECAAGDYTLSLTDFLANGGDGLAMLKDLKRETGPVFARDIIVQYVRDHRPLTAAVLGSVSAGGRQRITTIGTAPGSQEE